MSSNRVYHWRLLLEEYGPKIVYIKGIHNTAANTTRRLDFNPDVKHNPLNIIYNNSEIAYNHLRWQAFSTCLTNCESSCDTVVKDTLTHSYINAFANRSKEEASSLLLYLKLLTHKKLIQAFANSLSVGAKIFL